MYYVRKNMEMLCTTNTNSNASMLKTQLLCFIIITYHHLNIIPAIPPEKIVMAVYSNKAPFAVCQLHAKMPNLMTKLLT